MARGRRNWPIVAANGRPGKAAIDHGTRPANIPSHGFVTLASLISSPTPSSRWSLHAPSFLFLAALAASASLNAVAQTPITLDQAMANPDWIGPPVESAWWSWDGKRVLYKLKRAGVAIARYLCAVDRRRRRDPPRRCRAGGDRRQLAGLRCRPHPHGVRAQRRRLRTRPAQRRADPDHPQHRHRGRRRNIRPMAAACSSGSAPTGFAGMPARDWSARSPLPVADKDPAAAPAADALRDMQLRLIATLDRQKQEREALRSQAEAQRKSDPTPRRRRRSTWARA